MEAFMNNVAVGCTAALGFLLFGLGWPVSGVRFFKKRFSGYETDPSDLLFKVVRAHGNTAEYAPFFAILFLYLGARHAEPWVMWTMIAATACRYLLVIGMIAFPTLAKPNPVRFFGAAGTYCCGLALCYAALRTL